MKKNKLTKIAATIIFIGVSQQASAQWAVFDAANTVQTTITATASKAMATLEAYYKPRQDAQGSAMVNAQNATNASIDALTKQQVIQAQDTDYRLRKALGESEEAKRLLNSLPTIGQCAEASKGAAGTTQNNAVVAANKRYSGGSNGSPARSAAVTSTAAALGQVLNQKQALGTCHSDIIGAAGCTSVGVYAGGDTDSRSIKGNIKNLTNNTKADAPEVNNYTFDKQGLEVAKKYATDATMYDKPKKATPEALAKNPSYAAVYESMMTKLNAANTTLLDVLKMSAEADPKSSAVDYWKTNVTEAKFKKATGLSEFPKNPSLFDVLNYQVSNSYMGDEKADLSSTEEVNNRLALNNYIMWQQYKEQRNANILMSHILVQLTTPVSKSQVDAEFNKTMSYK
jgi:hypothetical protein